MRYPNFVPKITKEEFDILQPRCKCPCNQLILWNERYKYRKLPQYLSCHGGRGKPSPSKGIVWSGERRKKIKETYRQNKESRINNILSKGTKQCCHCKKELSLECFYNDCHNTDIKSYMCKECSAIRNKKNRKKFEEYFMNYALEYGKRNPYRVWATATLNSHRQRGIEINITRTELEKIAIGSTNCFICGCEMNWNYGTKNRKIKPNSPTLDRKDNGNTISSSSILILCHQCNATKRGRTFKQFVEYCGRVSEKFRKSDC